MDTRLNAVLIFLDHDVAQSCTAFACIWCGDDFCKLTRLFGKDQQKLEMFFYFYGNIFQGRQLGLIVLERNQPIQVTLPGQIREFINTLCLDHT